MPHQPMSPFPSLCANLAHPLWDTSRQPDSQVQPAACGGSMPPQLFSTLNTCLPLSTYLSPTALPQHCCKHKPIAHPSKQLAAQQLKLPTQTYSSGCYEDPWTLLHAYASPPVRERSSHTTHRCTLPVATTPSQQHPPHPDLHQRRPNSCRAGLPASPHLSRSRRRSTAPRRHHHPAPPALPGSPGTAARRRCLRTLGRTATPLATCARRRCVSLVGPAAVPGGPLVCAPPEESCISAGGPCGGHDSSDACLGDYGCKI
jgi:hypothetical protein